MKCPAEISQRTKYDKKKKQPLQKTLPPSLQPPTNQTKIHYLLPPRSVRSRPWLCSWPRSTSTSAASTSLAFFSHAWEGGEKKKLHFWGTRYVHEVAQKVVHCTSVEETVFTEVFSSSGRDFHLPIIRALWSLLPLFWLFFNGFGIQRYWCLLFSFYFSWGSWELDLNSKLGILFIDFVINILYPLYIFTSICTKCKYKLNSHYFIPTFLL